MTFEECQMAILHHYIDKNEVIQKLEIQENKNVKHMTELLEGYLRRTQLICYGGTAINTILPESVKFYDKEIDTPDYDCYTTDPIKHATEIADMYVQAGYSNVEAKAAVHMGTIKVFVNFVNMADLTLLNPILFRNFKKEAIKRGGIYYAPPNVLRMNSYIEISSPKGFVGRWEKVVRRLSLLDHYYPLRSSSGKCRGERKSVPKEVQKKILDVFIDEGVVFFGGYINSFYSKFVSKKGNRPLQNDSQWDVLSLDPQKTAERIKTELTQIGIQHISIKKHPALDELIPASYEIRIDDKPVSFLYEPKSCHNYNTIHENGKTIRIATIDTILAFFLAFYYSGRPQYDKNRILCMAAFFFDLQKKTKLLQTGILKRFNSSCIGHTQTLEEILEEKLKEKKNQKSKNLDNELRFFHYVPIPPV